MNPNIFAVNLEWIAQKSGPLTDEDCTMLRKIAAELRGVRIMKVGEVRRTVPPVWAAADECEVSRDPSKT